MPTTTHSKRKNGKFPNPEWSFFKIGKYQALLIPPVLNLRIKKMEYPMEVKMLTSLNCLKKFLSETNN